MAYWSFSDVFEEQGVVRTPFYGGFGLIAEDDIPKPALNAFAMLHQLGDRRIALDSDSALATRRADGALVVALWNYAPPYGTGAAYTPCPPLPPAPSKPSTSTVKGAKSATARMLRLDDDHGNVLKAFDAMGRPPVPYPRADQAAPRRRKSLATPADLHKKWRYFRRNPAPGPRAPHLWRFGKHLIILEP